MEDYTPTTEAVRSGFVLLAAGDNLGAQQEAANGFDRWLDDHDAEVAAATRYATSIITTAKPGEVWEVTLEDGRKVRVMPHVSYGERVEFFGPEATYLLEDILDRRLIITADGEYVG